MHRPHDLTAAELRAYHRALRRGHLRRILISVTTLDGETLHAINPQLLDGQVTVDADAEVTRSLTLTLLDPGHSLNFDSESPGDGALFADRMLRVHYSIRVDELSRWVSVPVFTGPIVQLDRKGDVVDIVAHGKERLALGEMWRPLTIKKGTRKVDAIETILRDRAGETRFALPELAVRMPRTRSLDRFAAGWKHARRIARSLDRQLFYPGTGVCTLRRLPRRPLFTFTTGDHGQVLSDVAISNTIDDLKNVVLVVGGKPKGAKRRVRYVARAPKGHPLSPENLGREDAPRFLVERIDDDNIRSVKEAKRRAERVLEDRLRSVVEVTFDSAPVPHLDPLDLVRVQTPDGVVVFRLRKFTLPLGTEGDPVMSVGYHKKVSVNRRRIRARSRRRREGTRR